MQVLFTYSNIFSFGLPAQNVTVASYITILRVPASELLLFVVIVLIFN